MVDAIKSLINEEYNKISSQIYAPISNSIKKVLHPQTIKGHAESGHGLFNGVGYDLSFNDIFDALDINPNAAAKYRETLIYETMDFVDDLIDGKTKKIVNKHGKPLFRFSPLEKIIIQDKKSIIKGMVLAGRMDSNEWRAKTVEKYKVTLDGEPLMIGRGKEERVNINQLKLYGLTEKKLAKSINTDLMIDRYKRFGVIVDKKRKNSKNIQNMFVRTASGLGCCDDSSILSMGLIHGPETIWGGWMVDAVDTYTKFIHDTRNTGMDEIVGEYAAHKWKEKYNENVVSSDEVMQIIYLGSKNNAPKINMSSSHSRFIRYEKGQNLTTIENHYNYAENHKRPNKSYKLGFTRFDTDKFYDSIESRFSRMGLEDLAPKKKKSRLTKISRKLKKVLKKNGKK